jgi:hypothetical protein
MKKYISTPEYPEGIVVDMTAEEISQRETDIAEFEAQKTAKANAKQAKADLKASAKTKLMNGEALTEEEANVMVGL